MPARTPHETRSNGTDKKSGVNGTKDVEMKDDKPTSLKGKKGKDGEDEMTVVVPPSKGSKLSAPPPKDGDGDVAMDGSMETAETAEDESEKEDPVAKAVAGISHLAAVVTNGY